MPKDITLAHLILSIIVALLGSGVIAAIITSRAGLRGQSEKWKQSIHDEVRADLRHELEETEKKFDELRQRHEEMCRALDRLSDNVRRFCFKVKRLTQAVIDRLPQFHHLAEDVSDEATVIINLLPPLKQECNAPAPGRSPPEEDSRGKPSGAPQENAP